ncbi:hypothetical protein GRJ2_002389500 [Grus japonensis]|uniref:ribonuclease H n=1 Tax=Grus japonensis TaxID=30415 RepID=A0ABC9XNJ8_GRUJA
MSAAVPDMLELQYELESKAAKWYATIDIANAFFSIPLAAECRPQFAFTWRGIQYTWNRLPQGWKHSPTICHGLIQTALEKGEAPEHLQYIDDIIVWGNSAEEVSEKGKKIIQILLQAGFAIKQSKVKGPAQEIQFLGIRWHDGWRQIPVDIINKIAAMSPPTNKKETQAFLGIVGFWRMHIPNYSLIVSPLYHVTRKKNDFKWGPEQRQAFEQIKQEIVHAVALGPVRAGPDVKNVLYTAAGENGPTWSLWQKAPGETRGRPLGFWSRGYRGSEGRYTPTEKEILAAYEGVRAASEVIGTEAQLLLAPRLPVLGWMFKERAPSTHHATDATWSKWVALITQRAQIGSPSRPGILEVITDWPEGKDFGMSPEEEVTRAEEAPPYNKLTEDEKPYALFTDGSCRIVGKHRKWKAAVWSPIQRVAEAAEGQGESSQFAEVKAIQLALDIAEREKWPTLYLYTDSWMVANALWGWLQQWKRSNWQRRGKPIWAAPLWQDIAARLEKLVVKVRHVDAHVPKSRATEEHRNNQQVDQAAKIEVAQVDLDWQRKGELFIARWAHDTSGHQGRDATYRWARDQGVDLSMDAISQVIHQCETCAVIKQAKRVKPLWYGGRWLKYKYGEAWQTDYITLPQSRQGKRYVLTMVEVTTGWLETYPVPHATARNTILGLEKQVLWQHGTPERIESDNGTHFRNNLIDTWAKEHGIEWVYHIPYHAPASGKIESKTSCSLGTQPPELEDRDRDQNEVPRIQGEMVSDLLHHLDTHKSMGPDGIHPRVLRELAEVLTKPLSIIYQQSWLTKEVPVDWRLANMTPICKKGWKEDPGNYRPVSLTSVPGKIMEQIILSAIIWHAQDNQVIRPSQHGSCLTSLISFNDKVTCLVDEGKAVDIVYLDFSKAFEIISQSILPERLAAYGLDGRTLH